MKGDRRPRAGRTRTPRALTAVVISLFVAAAVALPMALRVAEADSEVEQTTSTTTEVVATQPDETPPPSVLGATELQDPEAPAGSPPATSLGQAPGG